MDTIANPETAAAEKKGDVLELVRRAKAGDEAVLPELRRLLNDEKVVEALGGHLAKLAEQSFIRSAAGTDLAFREAAVRKLEMLRAELAGPSPTPVEKLLVERAVACWLAVQDAEIRYAQTRAEPGRASEALHQRRMDGAHRRFLSALKTLMLARKLALPALQLVNVSQQQINVVAVKDRLNDPDASRTIGHNQDCP